MKRISLYSFALSALLCLAGCADEDSFGTSSVRGDNSLVAVIEGQETDAVSRTAVDETGRVTWITTDALGVYAAHTENALFSSTGSGASVVFKGNLSPTDEAAEWAYYPYDANAVVNGQTLSFTLPDEYTYTGNSNAPMLAVKGSEGNFEFKHLCGLLRITLGGGMPADADRFVISSVGDDAPALSGLAIVNDVTAANATLALPKDGGRTITYTLGALSSAEELQHFFVPLPVGSYPKLQVAFYLKDKTEPEFTRTLSGLQVRRAVMTCMPILDWRTGEQFVLNENTIEITDALAKHVSVSPEDNTTLLYKAPAADAVPNVGRVVWSRVSDDFPYGFLGKVTKVTANGDGSYTVETGVAALSEAFDELYVDETVELKAEDTVEPRALGTGGFDILKEFSFKVQDKDKDYKASGQLSLGATFQATINISQKQKLNYMALSLIPRFEMEAGFSIAGDFNEEGNIGKFSLRDQNLGLIMLGNLIPLVSAIQCHLYVTPQGSISLGTSLNYKAEGTAAIIYKNGSWEKGFNPSINDKESPWDLNSSISIKGELFYGCGAEVKGKLYNRNDLKIYIEPTIGIKLEGELSINSDEGSVSLVDKLKNLSLESSYVLSGHTGADATLFTESAEVDVEFPEVSWGKKTLYVLPLLKNIAARIGQGRSRAISSDVEITMDVERELLSKETLLNMRLMNENAEYLDESEKVLYRNLLSNDENPVSLKFSQLQEGEYETYPVIYSPLFDGVLEGEQLELKDQSIKFEVGESDIDILKQLYWSTNGDNWTFNMGWNTNLPLDQWYGVKTNESGRVVALDLHDNNLTGSVFIENMKYLTSLDLSGNQSLEKVYCRKGVLEMLNLSGCSMLADLDCTKNQLLSLDVSGCENLKRLYCYENQLPALSLEDCKKLGSISCHYNQLSDLDVSCIGANLIDLSCSNNQLVSLNISGCTELQSLICDKNMLTSLQVSHCTKLQILWCSTNQLTDLDLLNCTALKRLLCYSNPDITDLDLSGLINLEEIHTYSGNLKSLKVTGCTSLKTLLFHETKISSLDCSGCINLYQLGCSDNQLEYLNVLECMNLKELMASNNQIKVLDLSNLKNLDYLALNNNPLVELNLRGCTKLNGVGCYNCKLEKIHLSVDQMGKFGFGGWGAQDSEIYLEPVHRNGYQYPEYLYE